MIERQRQRQREGTEGVRETERAREIERARASPHMPKDNCAGRKHDSRQLQCVCVMYACTSPLIPGESCASLSL